MDGRNIEDAILSPLVKRGLQKVLNPFFHDLCEIAKGIDDERLEGTARLILLEKCHDAFGEIYQEQKARAEHAKRNRPE